MNHRTRKKNLKMNKCKYCLVTQNLSVDHKIPLILGGKDEPDNFQCLCVTCNGTKSGMTHGAVLALARWIYHVNLKRALKGKRPLGLRKKDYAEKESH